MSRCPSRQELKRFVAEDLDAAECESIESHVDNCGACGEVLESLAADVPAEWRDWWHDVGHLPASTVAFDLDRYSIREELGRGGFGTVFRCYDRVLRHDVAIKVPHAHRISNAIDVDAYLNEARRWICLDHPGIARFLHAECWNGSCYLVTKFIAGYSLRERIDCSRPSYAESAAILAQVARAVHYVHEQQQYHRDIKPSNILLDENDRAFLTDFGLALAEAEIGTGTRQCGTLRYLSPEQASGEGHFVDGRTDIYSLGVVFYELLTGQVPFNAGSDAEVREQIIRRAPRPPRMIDDCIPRELERICLKALSKRLGDRYQTANDLADDLERWQEPSTSVAQSRIVPKGLRSFDAADSEFFLELLPGPRHRDGLPESIRFWKTRIEETDPEQTFRAGLLSGPSGCGKSSLVKAGLLPALAPHVIAVYLEADASNTETRLLKSLRRSCPALPPDLNLVHSVTAVRTGVLGKDDRKVLLVLDQFEQWLHAHPADPGGQLIQALRQCDGARTQCLIMVRDDFATAVRRFMHQLEVPIAEYQNFVAVDIFDLKHAHDVLAAFGRAYRQLPEDVSHPTEHQDEFLDEALKLLADKNMVVPAHLALFAHMIRGCEWVPHTLQELGGIEGIGVKFLVESFSQRNPEHLLHETAARHVLKALLPPKGTNIRGKVRSRSHLIRVSGCDTEDEFNRLIRILNDDLKLLTPTERDRQLSTEEISDRGGPEELYQLTHDIMVPALRRWLTRGEQTTARGRAELCLEERASEWMQSQERRFLPSALEWIRIVILTSPAKRSAHQRAMMQSANRYYAARMLGVAGICALMLIGVAGLWNHFQHVQADTERKAILERIVEGETSQVVQVLQHELPPYQPEIEPLLRERLHQVPSDSQSAMHLRLALLPSDPTQLNGLLDDLLTVPLGKLIIVCDVLDPHAGQLVPKLWEVAQHSKNAAHRLNALAALTQYDPPTSSKSTPKWHSTATFMAEQLVVQSARDFPTLEDLFYDVRSILYSPLHVRFTDPDSQETRFWATAFLSTFTRDHPGYRAELLMDADEWQFQELIEEIAAGPDEAVHRFHAELDKFPLPTWEDSDRGAVKDIPQSARETLVAGHGIITSEFAFCQSLPFSTGLTLHEELDALGFRMVRCRPFGQPGSVRMAAIWLNDGIAGQAFFGVSNTKISEAVADLEESGNRVIDVAGYCDGTGETVEWYVVLGEAGTGAARQVLAGLHMSDRNERTSALRAAGYYPTTHQCFSTPSREVRYSAIWQTATEHILEQHPVNLAEKELPPAYVLSDIQLPLDDSSRSDAATFLLTDRADFEALMLHNRDLTLHQAECRRVADLGYRPVSISVQPHSGLLQIASIWHRPVIPETERDRLASRQANAALALMRLGRHDEVWPLFRFRPDPRLRSYIIDRVTWTVDAEALLERMQRLTRVHEEDQTSELFGLILAIGNVASLSQTEVESARELLQYIYVHHPDSGVHSAAEWTLKQMGADVEQLPPTDAGSGNWFVDSFGHTMHIVRGPVRFVSGSPASMEERSAGETLRNVTIDYSFAIGIKEVTMAEYDRFVADEPTVGKIEFHRPLPSAPNLPRNAVSWYQAAAYCNWLSQQANLPPNEFSYIEVTGADGKPYLSPAPDYTARAGYRLPTDLEHEYACRAGTTTRRYYGNTDELLLQYGYVNVGARASNRVGQLKPNDFGLFDAMGNLREWSSTEMGDSKRLLLGGSFYFTLSDLRSASRAALPPGVPANDIGFRLARTLK